MESRCDLPMRSKSSGLMMFDVMAAMCAGNRGIGWKGGLPWPPLRKDYEYYTTVTSTHMKVGRGKIVHLHGRHSWASCSDHQKAREGVYHVVISRTMDNRH
ncbi:dihydrofolate reductase-like [Mya arenaria]|uniref:dihydrofolate reductase-like n=1 Tax=Mya arenaria TaxID=6604 RepID=UPI0022E101C9|nr:dihydrofolate reductase-like [Mya arenaria]